jgi:hypothetical protein
MKKWLPVLFFIPALNGMAQTAGTSEKQIILEKINHFFLALEKKDTALYKSLVMPEAQITTVRRRNDSLINTMRTVAGDMESLATGKQLIEEKPFRIDITLHHDIAIAWVPYTISIGGKFSHCGIDVFTFLNSPGGWKIASMAYSIEPEGCTELKKH